MRYILLDDIYVERDNPLAPDGVVVLSLRREFIHAFPGFMEDRHIEEAIKFANLRFHAGYLAGESDCHPFKHRA